MLKSTKSGIKRFPYYLDTIIGGSENFTLIITSLEVTDEDEEYEPRLGLPVDMAYFIFQHCRCVFCSAPISRDLSRCACGDPDDEVHLEVECATEIFYSVFKPLLAREKSRITAFRRRQMVEANGGSHTKKDLAILYQLQEGLCYFCGEPFAAKSQGNSYHADHYLPICEGGKNDSSNLVLTCPSCNFRKNAMDGDSFERIARKMRSPEIGRKLGRIRKKIKTFRATSCASDVD